MDLLVNAEQVNLVIVDAGTDAGRNSEERSADEAIYLARHGVNVVVDRMAGGGRPVEAVLQQHAS
ncbi:hypothetical protein [Pseudorhizobium flavum]|uniref:hypothetical protein n=1 Tax=Pseudorhizobium flavum TaxID=1335061 RepID=UPI0024927221|nr:hypothetical protein [Pseudorhizobium flavum]